MNNDNSSAPPPATLSQSWLTVGRMVSVAPRTWPGMNRPGGLGHIEKIYTSSSTSAAATANSSDNNIHDNSSVEEKEVVVVVVVTHVDVKYLPSELVTRDRGIPIQYITDHHHVTMEIMGGNVGAKCGAGRRHRRNLINSRRCTECGSFAIDCGNCDWRNEELRAAVAARKRREEEEAVERVEKNGQTIKRQKYKAVVVGSKVKKRERIDRYVSGDSTSTDDGSSCSSSTNNTSDEDAIIDSEEEEIRNVKTMNRHRIRNGQITRRRRRMRRRKQISEQDYTNDEHHDDTSDDEDDDEVPLAILQHRIERAMRAQERKLRDMKRIMKRQGRKLLQLPSFKNGGSSVDVTDTGETMTKVKKYSNRTRPQNACTLMGIAAEGRFKVDATMEQEKKSYTTSNDRTVYDTGDSDETIRMSGDNAGAVTAVNLEHDSSSDDDDLVTFGELRSRATIYSSTANSSDMVTRGRNSNYNSTDASGNVDHSTSSAFVDEYANHDDADEELLTPREFDEDEIEGERGSEGYDSASEPMYSLEVDDLDGDDCGSSRKNSRIVMETDWGDLPTFISELCLEVHNHRIVYAQNTLNSLKRKLQATKSLHKTTTTTQEMLDSLMKLSEESDVLNQYIIEELHRNGVDLCNKALMRLLSKRERRENENKLTVAQKKLCRITAVDMWDVRVVELCDLVREVDSNVTSFQKEVEKELQLADENIGYGDANDSIAADAFPANVCGRSLLESHHFSIDQRAKSDDQHPHASRKRKHSSEQDESYLKRKRRQQDSRRKSYSIGNPNTDFFERGPRRPSPSVEISSDDQTYGAVELIGAECTTSFEPVDFVGDTDDRQSDTDESNPVGKSGTGRASCNTVAQQRLSKSGSAQELPRGGRGRGLRRQICPMAETMSDWLDKQDKCHVRQRHQERTIGRQSSGKHVHNAGISDNEAINNSRTKTSRTSEGPVPRIPNELSADILFDSILENINKHSDREQYTNSGIGRTLIELCCELKDHYPSNMPLCRNILDTLTTAVVLATEEVIQKNDIIAIFQTLLSVFQMQCTTLLDMIQNTPYFASFHIDCWCLVFRMFEKKLNEILCPHDGLICKIFGNSTNLANHLLLQTVDALYSQLSWEEYVLSPTFNSRVYDELRSLCIRIGYVVPLLPTACELLTRNLDRPRWFVSMINDQKENEPGKALFVSAIDPCTHKAFVTSGVYPGPSQDNSRVRSFKYRIPREEIEFIWSIIGFFSSCSNFNQVAPDFKLPQQLLAGLLFYDCGTLSKTEQQLPPSKLQIDTCLTEIKWISVLLSSRLLGDLPSMDSFMRQMIEKSVVLEAWDAVLIANASPPHVIGRRVVKKLWEYSCFTGSSARLESTLQSGLVNVNSFFLDGNTPPFYSLCPSSILLQRCVSMAASYSSMMMVKNARWKKFRTVLVTLASEFMKRARDVEAKAEQRQPGRRQINDDFSAMFHSIIESASDVLISETPTSSHFREAACYLILSGVVARSRFSTPGDGSNFHLNNALRENIWRYSSDEKMRTHQTHFLDGMSGDAPEISSNLSLLRTSSKVLILTSFLHLYVSDLSADPNQITELLRSHLVAVKAEIDDNVMVYLLTPVIANLIAVCGHLESLNKRCRISENEEQCKAHLDASKYCADIIWMISTWINLTFGRAKFIVELTVKVKPAGDELEQLVTAIKRLVSSRFFHFAVKSLTRSLVVIVETSIGNTFAKAMTKEGCLEKSFRSCLGTIRQLITLVSTCSTMQPEDPGINQNKEWQAAAEIYLSFVTTTLMPSIITENGSVENRKLCRSQSGGAFSVLAALCSISQASKALRNVHTIFEPSSVLDDESGIRMQQVATCFYCELIRLSKCSRDCRALAMDHVQKILVHWITVLLDSDTLAMFPTSNLSFLSQLDGHNSRSKGNDLLSKAQIHFHAPPYDPDQDAFKIKRMDGDYFDTAGPTYMCKNVWSFMMNFGHLLAVSNPYETKYPSYFQSMKAIGRRFVDICNSLHSGELEMIPQLSAERECLKRLIVFQKLLTSLTDGDAECLDAILGTKGSLCCVISKLILENLYYLSGVELDVEEQRRIGCDDAITSYHRAKSLAFQRAYTELCGSLITIMLRENMKNWEGNRIFDLMRSLILSAFRGDLDFRRTIEGAALSLNLRLRKKASKGCVHYLTNDLTSSFFRRASDLVVYSAGCSDNYRAGLFHAMFHGLPSKEADVIDSFIASISSRLILTSEAFGVKSTVARDALERAIDDRLLCSEVLRGNDFDGQKSILGLREWVMSNFFAAMLRNQGTAKSIRLIVLKSLARMIKTFSLPTIPRREKICDQNGNLTSVTTFVKLLYSLKECLSNLVRSGTSDAIVVAEFFSCARDCFEMPMLINATLSGRDDTTTMLSWARASSKVNNESDPHSLHYSAYINKVSLWLKLCGMLLRQQKTAACLRNFLIRITDCDSAEIFSLDNIEANTPEMQQLCSMIDSLNTLEGELTLRMAKSIRGQISNPYAAVNSKTSSSTTACETLVNPQTIESLEAINKFCDLIGPQ